MKIYFYGAAHGVTGSKHLVEINGTRILLDCGLFQGKRKESYELNKQFPFDAATVDAMVLSHAHIDHCGSIPILVKNGFRGKIYCTSATKDVAELMLKDSAHIQEMDAEYFCRHSEIEACIPKRALYTTEDAIRSLPRFVGKQYHERFEIADGIFCIFYDAGHILGSAVTVLEFTENGEKKRLVFTGDLGRADKLILRDPESPDWGNYLITESTYGDRQHEPPPAMREELENVVNKTAKRGGKLVIPAFSLERTQELVYDLHILTKEKRIPQIPIFVDSPLATRVTRVFQEHSECYDEETIRDFVRDGKDPFCCFGNLQYTESVDDSKKINRYSGPCIILSASGMCEAGRIRHHLKNTIEDPRNMVLIVSYQAQFTLGRRIVERRPFVNIFNKMYKVRAEVHVLNGYSSHADTDDLVRFATSIEGVSHVFLVHGEISQSEGLAKKLRKLKKNWTIEIPERGDCLDPEEITYERSEKHGDS